MSELTDDQLDGLFRKSAEEFDPPFDPAAWQDMKTRLDTHDRTVTGGAPTWKNLLRWGMVAVVLLLLLGGVWFSYQHAIQSAIGSKRLPTGNEPQPEASTTTLPQRAPVSALGKIDPAQKSPASSPTDRPDGNEQRSEANQPAVSTEPNMERDAPVHRPDRVIARTSEPKISATDKLSNAILSTDGVAGERTEKSERSPSVRPGTTIPTTVRRESRTALKEINRKRGSRLATQNRIKKDHTGRETAYSSVNNGITGMSLFSKKPVQNKLEPKRIADGSTFGRVTSDIAVPEAENAGSVSLPTLSELAIRPARWPVLLTFRGRDVVAQPDTTARKSVPKQEPMRGLSVRLALAPDLSAIGLKNFTRPGTNVGLLLEYRLASRWSVQAGVIQSTKIYTARTTEYELPYPIMKQTVKPVSVDGECRMFDIPINLRYDVVLRPRADGRPPNRWFVSGGVTSYIIKKEDYIYNYPPHTYNVITGWSGEGSTSTGGFGFSQLNLSAGYERAISKRLSWQVEPFIKAPLRGVGYLKINLLSTGAFFSIRYKL